MPRASFSDTARGGGFGFQEGRVLITESYSTIFQYPPNASTKEQSAAFTAMVWKGHRLDKDGNALEMEDIEIIQTMGDPDSIRPGNVAEKDFDNLNVEPEDLGKEVDVRGNSFVVESGATFDFRWGIMEKSLKDKGFKPEILGRCIATDFEGMDATFKTVAGKAYIAMKGVKKGQTVVPNNLVCDHITVFPYDKKKPAPPATRPTTKLAQPTLTDAPKANGEVNIIEVAKVVFGNLSTIFKAVVPPGKEIERVAFQRALTAELMRQGAKSGITPAITKLFIECCKSDDKLTDIAVETGAFTFDGTNVILSE